MLRQYISGALIVSTLAIGTAQADGPPAGYSQLMTYIGNGEYDAAVPNPVVANCQFGGFCFDDYFGKVVQRRSREQEAAVKAQAEQYFRWKFGLGDPGVTNYEVKAFTLDPRVKYRAYTISGQVVPKEGVEVRDGGYIAILTAEQTLGGQFAGQTYPKDTMFIFGENNIDTGGKGTVISYRFRQPIFAGTDVSGFFNPNINVTAAIELRNGSLLQTNFGSPFVAPQGLAALSIGVPSAFVGVGKSFLRTVLTFSSKGGL